MSIKDTTKEIKVRYLSPSTVVKLDELATKRGLSRNDYLKNQLELLASSKEIFEFQNKYNILIEKILKVLEYNTVTLKTFLEENLIDLDEAIAKEFLKDGEIDE
ncbi:hypothetical protein KQI36_16050 [Clostridium senegalense]|uniref:hypothetical protein n=1 Tax=Clostridium senegalense TaxID=1465809 RepID=UPI001C11E401|nr:hypothetical protein [Clostridium senegalense]MBU5228145.1 hypothetical protein [Clostridium senegalense]